MKTTTRKARSTKFTDITIAATAAAVGVTEDAVRKAVQGYHCSSKDSRYTLACEIQSIVDPGMEAYCDVCEAAYDVLKATPRDIEAAFRAARAALARQRIKVLEIQYGARKLNPDDIYGCAW